MEIIPAKTSPSGTAKNRAGRGERLMILRRGDGWGHRLQRGRGKAPCSKRWPAFCPIPVLPLLREDSGGGWHPAGHRLCAPAGAMNTRLLTVFEMVLFGPDRQPGVACHPGQAAQVEGSP